MFRFIIIWKEDPDIWWSIEGPSYIDALKKTLTYNPLYFGVEFENYLDDQEIIKRGSHYNSLSGEDEEVFYPTPEQFEKCMDFHRTIFESVSQYIIFQINFCTGTILQLERQDLV